MIEVENIDIDSVSNLGIIYKLNKLGYTNVAKVYYGVSGKTFNIALEFYMMTNRFLRYLAKTTIGV